MDAKPATNQPWANPQVRVAAVIILIIAVVAGLWLGGVFKSKHGKGGGTAKYRPISAEFLSPNAMKNEGKHDDGQLFYWAGPKPGFQTEFRRTVDGYIFVRYLPKHARLGANGDFLIVASYPFPQAVNGLIAEAKKKHAKVQHGFQGAKIYVDPHRPRTVYMAFPGINVQVEIFGKSPLQAINLAKSGNIRLVQ